MEYERNPSRPPGNTLRWMTVVAGVLLLAGPYAYTRGWFSSERLTPARVVDELQRAGGPHAGFRRNHAKGVCVTGFFEGNGNASSVSTASVFTRVRTPVVGRFAIAGGNPYAADDGAPVRSMALRFNGADGQQWRTGMNNMPVFSVATPEAFYAQLVAKRKDPATGKPDPKKIAAFNAAYPETAAFRAWAKTAKPSASFTTETYYGLNAFYFINESGARQAVRWKMVPEAAPAVASKALGKDVLMADLQQRLAAAPQRWRLWIILAEPGDPTNDATKAWPDDRRAIDAGLLTLTRETPQSDGACRDINYDPSVLPDGIAISDDPLLVARSAAYSNGHLRRTREEAHVPLSAALNAAQPESN
ncbi:catalase family peroxidase [Lysobacter sp. HDW10]|uniref:catalase family peroxidase n=1 Tax=Lysobacter sp. HDW10 TaxID=2714936 RepID=UPI00140A2646|nr:catalase family peroxidase [Lysobacter sp. HDW10]QIK80534.1 catalase family peroxidase [Lysobacter sp. HDW10]